MIISDFTAIKQRLDELEGREYPILIGIDYASPSTDNSTLLEATKRARRMIDKALGVPERLLK